MPRTVPKYRPGKRKKKAQVQVRVWLDVPVLGKLLLIVGMLRVRGNGRAGLSSAIDAVLRGGTKPVLRGASAQELDAAIAWVAKAFPAFGELLHTVQGAARDTYRRRTDDSPSVTE